MLWSEFRPESEVHEALEFFGDSNIIGLGLGMHKTGLESRIWADTKIKPINLAEAGLSETGFI